MPIYLPEKCHRGLLSCIPLASIESDSSNQDKSPCSFICVGKNDGSEVKSDRQNDIFTLMERKAPALQPGDISEPNGGSETVLTVLYYVIINSVLNQLKCTVANKF